MHSDLPITIQKLSRRERTCGHIAAPRTRRSGKRGGAVLRMMRECITKDLPLSRARIARGRNTDSQNYLCSRLRLVLSGARSG